MRARKTLVAGLVAGAVCLTPAAGLAYGPGGGGNPTPPGFGPTISSGDCGSDGCSVSGDWNRCHLTVTVPAGTFAHVVSVVISKITNTDADKHLKNSHSICAFGVGFFRDGQRIHVAKGRPSAKLLFTGDPIHPTDHLVILVPGDGATPKAAHFSDSKATSTLRTTRELAIVRANS